MHAVAKRPASITRNGREWKVRTVGSRCAVKPNALCRRASASIASTQADSRGATLVRGEHALERRADLCRALELCEGRAEPLRVRRVAALEQEAEPHRVAREPCSDDARAELVADLGGSADERLLLVDAPPLAADEPAPDVVGVPLERFSQRLQLTGSVPEDLPGGDLGEQLLRSRQPLEGREAGGARRSPVVVRAIRRAA